MTRGRLPAQGQSWFWKRRAWHERTVLALERKVAEQPDNPLLPLELGRIYEFRMGHADGSAYRANGVLAVKHYEAWAKRCEPENDDSPLNRLPYLALEFTEPKSAQRHALALAAVADAHPDWGNAVHHAWTVLGLVALTSDDTDEAERCLLKAGATPGSPQLNRFGPSFQLARGLLDAGRREPLREYLALCGRFWTSNQGRLARWIEQLDAGQTPAWSGRSVDW